MKISRLYRLIVFTILAFLINMPGSAQRSIPEGERRSLHLGPEVFLDPFDPSGQLIESTTAPQSPAMVKMPWSKLVYQSFRNQDNYDIFVANDDGSGEMKLMDNPAEDIQPRLNRGGTKVAFSSKRSGNYDIFTVDVNNTNGNQLTANTQNNQKPAWSPDGSKIAFQSYRDGNWEVYVMNADGTNQTRLTNTPGGYSGEPSWSPDGSRIAYTSYQNGSWRIWVMNADGSGQNRLSLQAYSENPVWSPDGKRIAFDCDGDADGWQEIYLMDADGTNFQIFATPNWGNDEALMNSWSPDGTYIAYTHVKWINQNNAWYWTVASIVFKSENSSEAVFFPNTLEWSADWQSLDAIKPQFTIEDLPSISPGPITLNWNASDQGGSGIRAVEAQVRENPTNPWTDWIKTTDPISFYPGIGSHTYYFRYRVVDGAWNITTWSREIMTTVENLPPASGIKSLPQYSPLNFLVNPIGIDPGGSGIKQYFVDYRDGINGIWTSWSHMDAYKGLFLGMPGHTYYFRARAIDNAENIETWDDPSIYDAVTTTYSFYLRGKVVDIQSMPVKGVKVIVNPQPMLQQITSDPNGEFEAPIIPTGQVTATWTKTGYGPLPENHYTYTHFGQAEQLVILPPVDNIITNPGLEFTQTLAAPWNSGGVAEPGVVSQALTGQSSVRLGATEKFTFTPISPSFWHELKYGLAVDDLGTSHLVWYSNARNEMYYSQKTASGNWLPPEMFIKANPTLLIVTAGHNGALYVSWYFNYSLYQIRRNADGTWTSVTSRTYPSSISNIVSDSNGVAHFAWSFYSSVYYSQQDLNGNWSPLEAVMDNAPSYMADVKMTRDASGAIHLFWRSNSIPIYYYARRSPDGTWSKPQVIASWTQCGMRDEYILPDSQGNIDVYWRGETCTYLGFSYGTLMRKRLSDTGVWSDFQIVLPNYIELYYFAITRAPNDSLTAAWSSGSETNQDVSIMQSSPDGIWSSPELLIDTPNYVYINYLMYDLQGSLHMIWADKNPTLNESDINYWKQTNNRWIDYGTITTNLPTNVPSFSTAALDRSNRLQIVSFRDREINGASQTWLNVGELATPASDGLIYIAQTVHLPAEKDHPLLSFGYNLQNVTAENQGHFDVLLSSDGVTTTLLSYFENTPEITQGWASGWADVSAWVGQTVTITFQMNIIKNSQTPMLLLDDITIGSLPIDVWVSSAPKTALPGSQVVYALSYGNQGGLPAENVVITHTLSADMTFISASLPVTPTDSTLTWNLGTLPGNSSGVIYITVALPARLKPGACLLGILDISTQTSEPEIANNTAQTKVFIGHQIFLPIIQRK